MDLHEYIVHCIFIILKHSFKLEWRWYGKMLAMLIMTAFWSLTINQTRCHKHLDFSPIRDHCCIVHILQDVGLDFTEFVLLGYNFLWYPSALLAGGKRQIEVSEQRDGKGSRNRAAYQTGRPQQITGGIVARETQVSSLALALGRISLALRFGFFPFSNHTPYGLPNK
mgnify:CR=1 FL=1